MNAENRALVVVPTNFEMQQLLSGLSETGATARVSTHGRLSTFDVDALGIVIAPGGLGKTQFAVHTQHLLSIAAWRSVICAGAAGALSDDVLNGDVVIGAETVEHDIRKVSRPMVPRFAADPALLDACRTAVASSAGLRVHFGAIASGDEDIVSDTRRSELRMTTGAIAVAWEGAGGARASQFSGVPYIEVRGITDGANPNGPQDFAAHLAHAMRNVAAVLTVIARRLVS